MKKLEIVLFLFFTSWISWAKGIKIDSLNYEKREGSRKVIISLEKEIEKLPELRVKGNYVQVSIPGSYVWPKIEKKFSFEKSYDSKLMAYQFNKDMVRVRTLFPHPVEAMKNNISLSLKGRNIIVHFPLQAKWGNLVGVSRSPAIIGSAEDVKVVPKYDESYLNRLLKENSAKEGKILHKKEGKIEHKKDKVSMALSANEKKKNAFPLTRYAGKFAAFLGFVLLLFYGMISLLKKGILKKGKLGFLNSTKIIEVLNTTYIAPKRSLLLIRAHNQVFLVGSSEKGLHMISEVNDMNGLLKEGEREISGSNFETNLSSAGKGKKDFKLKEFLNEESIEEVNGDLSKKEAENFALNIVKEGEEKAPKEKVKFSQQIKNKVKNLKPLQ